MLSAMATTLGLASCVNEDYDLSNLDTTIGVKVNDLTLALNLDAITLDKVIDLNEGDQLKEVIDPATGEKVYAVLENGNFESDPITINGFSTDAPAITPITDELPLKKINEEVFSRLDAEIDKETDNRINTLALEKANEEIARLEKQIAPLTLTEEQKEQIRKQAKEEADKLRDAIKEETRKDPVVRKQAQEFAWANITDDMVFAKYDISNAETEFKTQSDGVDKALRELTSIKATTKLSMNLKLTNLSNILDVVVEDVRIKLPKGLDMKVVSDSNGKYDPQTGILDLGNVQLKNGIYNLTLDVNGINVKDAGIKFTAKDNAPGSFEFTEKVSVVSGQVQITKKSFLTGHTIFELPDEASYICSPSMDAIEVKSVTGKIMYEIEKPNIDPVNMNDLPSILSDKETNIFLDNPQIYLSVSNPLAGDNLKAEVGLSLTALRDDNTRKTYTLDEGVLTIKPANEVEYCLSPKNPQKKYKDEDYDYSNAEFKGFKDLSAILSGKGLPEKIEVNVENAKIPEQDVTDFVLGRKLDPVKGNYLFYAPLTLGEGTIIAYRDTLDGWYDDDVMGKLTITGLKLTAKADSKLPVGAKLTAKPVNDKGQIIKGVEFTDVEIKQNGSQQIAFNMKNGKITAKDRLDGIILNATIYQDQTEAGTLRPANSIDLTDIKVTVSGEYIEPDND